jgi:hypothetical protein
MGPGLPVEKNRGNRKGDDEETDRRECYVTSLLAGLKAWGIDKGKSAYETELFLSSRPATG